MPLNFSYELDYSTFEQFAESNAVYAYMQTLTATHDDRKSEKLAANALFNVLKNKKHFDAEEKPIDEHTAVDLSMRPLLSKKEKEQLDTAPTRDQALDEFLKDDDNSTEQFVIYPPDEAAQRRIVKKACLKADSITPKYAPMYTGTKSGIILLVVLVFICAAIYFIWNDPADILADKSTAYTSNGTAASIPDSDSLIDVVFEADKTSQGSVPVRIYISGPDSRLVTGVTYSPDGSSAISSAYQCGDEYWVMMASSEDYYKVNIKGTGGLDVVRYFRVSTAIPTAPEITFLSIDSTDSCYTVTVSVETSDGTSSVSSSDIVNVDSSADGTYTVTVPFASQKTLYFSDSAGNCTAMLITGDGQVRFSPALSLKEISMGHDSVKTVDLSGLLSSDGEYDISVSADSENLSATVDSDNILTLTSANGFVGIDGIDLTVTDSYGLSSNATVPVIVLNSAPYCTDPTQLYATVLHTPSNTGHLFGTLSATDAQGDKLTYALANQTDCSVTLSPNGSFMLFIDPDYQGHSVSFDFTVSDGLLTSQQYRYTVSLYNNIISGEAYTQKFTCYGGENGWYTVELPKYDSDGDILNWTVTSELTDEGRTPEGNYIDFTDGLSTVLLRVNPERNEKFSETITLTCSDGWLSSDTVTLKCSFIENEPPRAGKNNSAVIDPAEAVGTFTLDIRDDCEFDKCVITSVVSCEGGQVTDYIGWNNLTFTVSFDSVPSEETVTAVFTVKDTVTGEEIEVEYTITRKG